MSHGNTKLGEQSKVTEDFTFDMVSIVDLPIMNHMQCIKFSIYKYYFHSILAIKIL